MPTWVDWTSMWGGEVTVAPLLNYKFPNTRHVHCARWRWPNSTDREKYPLLCLIIGSDELPFSGSVGRDEFWFSKHSFSILFIDTDLYISPCPDCCSLGGAQYHHFWPRAGFNLAVGERETQIGGMKTVMISQVIPWVVRRNGNTTMYRISQRSGVDENKS